MINKMLNQILEQAEKEIGEAVGEASMCWTELPQGTFESDRAKKIVERLKALFTAGVKKGVEEEKERVREICSKLDKDETKVFYEEQEEFISYNQALSDLLSELNKQER
jgi:hypothetical protein